MSKEQTAYTYRTVTLKTGETLTIPDDLHVSPSEHRFRLWLAWNRAGLRMPIYQPPELAAWRESRLPKPNIVGSPIIAADGQLGGFALNGSVSPDGNKILVVDFRTGKRSA